LKWGHNRKRDRNEADSPHQGEKGASFRVPRLEVRALASELTKREIRASSREERSRRGQRLAGVRKRRGIVEVAKAGKKIGMARKEVLGTGGLRG